MNNMSVVEVIKHYQRSILKCGENQERMLHCISKLYRLPITVRHLQDTGVGRTVNDLRRFEGDTGEAAKALVAKWKAMVAAEDSSEEEEEEEEEEQPDPEENNNSPEEERRSHRQEHHGSNKGRTSHRQHSDSKRHREEEKSTSSKKTSDQDQSKKRRHEEENGKVVDKRRRKQETDSDSSGSEDDFQESDFEYEDSGHDSEARSASQNVEDDSSESSEPAPRVREREKSHSNKHHNSHRKHKDRGSSSKGHKDDRVKIKTENKSVDESKHRKDEKRKVEGTHHHGDSGKKHKPKAESIPESSKLDKKSVKIKKEKQTTEEGEDGSIDCSTGASFAEALGMVDPVVKKKQQHTAVSSPGTSSSAGTPRSVTKSRTDSSSSKKKDVTGGSGSSSSNSTAGELGLLSPNVKLEPLDVDVDLDATLPVITPNYKPLPHFNLLDSPPHRKARNLTEEEALSQVMSNKNQRTKVYSGVKSGKSWANVPSLYDICVRVLQENIEALEYTGGVPYDLLKPVLQHATPEQLFMLEHHNPYLIEDTGSLWQFHCQREFRTERRQDMETAREMYLRCLDEREAKLKALTTNIQQSIAKSTPVRQTKLAYVDSVAKPPRNVARQQAKYGTARAANTANTANAAKPTPAQAKAVRVSGATATPVSAPTRHIQTVAKVKPRMAPLMQKTMKLVKSFKR